MNEQKNQLKKFGVILIGLVFVWYVFNNLLLGGRSVSYGHMGGYTNVGLDLQGLLAGILVFAIKILWLLVLVGILVGMYQLIKKYVFEENFNLSPFINKITGSVEEYSCPNCEEKLSQDFKFCPKCKQSLRNQCTKCGKELLAGWNCCPSCGTEKE